MLEPSDLNDLVAIVEIAVKEMYSRDYVEFLIEFIKWDDDRGYWVVGFYCEVGNIENIGVAVSQYSNGYRFRGLVYEN